MEDELLQAFCFPTGKISQRRCIACHNQEERTYVLLMDTYGMQLSWLWHVTQCIIYIHTCIKMFFYIFHSGLLSRWDESKHVFCHHHPHKSVMKGLSAPTSSPDALFEVSRHFLAQICWLLAQSAKTCQILPKSVTVTLVLKLLLFFLLTTACKQISRKGRF
jgi:hypothetical protein